MQAGGGVMHARELFHTLLDHRWPAPGSSAMIGRQALVPTLLERRRAHRSALVRRGPSPQPHHPLGLHGGERVRYRSAELELVGLFDRPRAARLTHRGRAPAVLYLHGGWALADADLLDCQPFLAAGFVVFAPAYRGENGNPGVHEMLYAELDDALAALAWLRAHPQVDPERLFVFGHSAGGMLAALLALVPELGVRLTGSANGIYDAAVFDFQRVPFVDTPLERELRLLGPHVEELACPHLACVGAGDLAVAPAGEAARRAAVAAVPFEVLTVPGDHYASLAPSIERYLERIIALARI
jgi:acetyl esterase/lipase